MSTQETIRVILVDDHPFVRDGVRMRLEATDDIQVVGEASSAVEAMQRVKEMATGMGPDILLTDISMPGMSGVQLIALFSHHFPNIDILVLSMHDNPEYVERAIESGAKGYILKDAPAQQLVNAIRKVHAGGTFFIHRFHEDFAEFETPIEWSRPLTSRESATLACLARGYSNKQIAKELGMSVRTVETHRLHLRRKLDIKGQAELVKYAIDRMMPLQERQGVARISYGTPDFP